MRCPHLVVATALVVVLAPAPAAADYTKIAPVRPLTMLDPTGLNLLGIDFQLATWDVVQPPPLPDLEFLNITFNIHADIKVAPHWLLLVRMPLSDVGIDDQNDATDNCCDLALGNLTLGGRGLWASVFDNGVRAVTGGELTLSVPTASDGAERGGSAAAGALAHLSEDPGLYAPNTTTVRFTLLAQLYRRYFLAHAELGMSMNYFDGDAGGDDDLDFGFRAALALGVRVTYKFALLFELNSLLAASDEFAGGDTAASIDLGLRYGSGSVILGVRAYVPIDDRRDLDMIGFGLDAGWRF